MGAWAITSLLLLAIIWSRGEANPQVFPKIKATANNDFHQFQTPREQQQYGFYYFPEEIQSASGLQAQNVKLTNINIPVRFARYGYNNPIDKASPLYESFDESFERNLESYQKRREQILHNQAAENRNGIEETDLIKKGYDDYKTSQTTNILGPHQIETIQSDNYHTQVAPYDISEFQHHGKEKHGEIHYHQHKHIHSHEHKQEHIHQHKQDHEHKHIHSQLHKHQHHSEHRHGHQHKHQHHQDHKHQHYQEHRHEHHQEHKHDHHHGHKHGHHHGHKHHHHGHHHHKHNHGHKYHHSKYY